jgi:hypothetical protein
VSVLVEYLTGLGDCLPDGVGVDAQQVGQDAVGADLAQVDDGDENPVCGGEQTAASRARCPTSGTAALLEAALSGLGLL